MNTTENGRRSDISTISRITPMLRDPSEIPAIADKIASLASQIEALRKARDQACSFRRVFHRDLKKQVGITLAIALAVGFIHPIASAAIGAIGAVVVVNTIICDIRWKKCNNFCRLPVGMRGPVGAFLVAAETAIKRFQDLSRMDALLLSTDKCVRVASPHTIVIRDTHDETGTTFLWVLDPENYQEAVGKFRKAKRRWESVLGDLREDEPGFLGQQDQVGHIERDTQELLGLSEGPDWNVELSGGIYDTLKGLSRYEVRCRPFCEPLPSSWWRTGGGAPSSAYGAEVPIRHEFFHSPTSYSMNPWKHCRGETDVVGRLLGEYLERFARIDKRQCESVLREIAEVSHVLWVLCAVAGDETLESAKYATVPVPVGGSANPYAFRQPMGTKQVMVREASHVARHLSFAELLKRAAEHLKDDGMRRRALELQTFTTSEFVSVLFRDALEAPTDLIGALRKLKFQVEGRVKLALQDLQEAQKVPVFRACAASLISDIKRETAPLYSGS